ncbi:hypothetical protein [Tomitella gaofuii]|uniref:hypothetical protein n=1 Tax=Tomitella gaofuii TaxID=2760083 RepID=UPI0020BF5B1D|nr:hypothetical protein [Tomitella gaofuii]
MALAGGIIAPGIASAADGGTTDSISPDSRVTVSATGNDDCTVDFTLKATDSDTANWVADYRVDGEDPTIESTGDAFFNVYHPVVTNQKDAAEALNGLEDHDYNVGVNTQQVDLSSYGPGEHTVTFKLYRGPSAGNWGDEEKQTGEITVTCADDQEDGTGSLGSLDVFGSLGSIAGIFES